MQPLLDSCNNAELYSQLGQVYTNRGKSRHNREFAIQVYKRAVQLWETLDLSTELAISLEQLGNLYFELKDNTHEANVCYDQALGIYREVGDRLGEANTLQGLGSLQESPVQAMEYYGRLKLFLSKLAISIAKAVTCYCILPPPNNS